MPLLIAIRIITAKINSCQLPPEFIKDAGVANIGCFCAAFAPLKMRDIHSRFVQALGQILYFSLCFHLGKWVLSDAVC